ncbi:hypothetical protein [Ostreiculturibacter nitratireducens]|uniref:hypothetical protein n=1 Tax=Ostreiculturibacter nitratireducens TaxID=3075226 RepID=UPI0031B5B311
MKRGNGGSTNPKPGPEETGTPRRVLIIGATRSLPLALQAMEGASLTVTQFSDVNSRLLDRAEPDIVLAPLFSNDFDITDLAAELVRLGYDGELRAFSRPLPAPKIVVSELRAFWPELDFDLIILPGD